ncbi:hypothetical protein BaOVIS_003110 [Babesia ovis]|uniref:Uncharacterized protein n=1 Tax=Babesia ovis TaxID=5869 RepID=A0A9W5TAH7_BABOV|nr:hypothetical protein BaOVIS_003110 [Babesia ovis]
MVYHTLLDYPVNYKQALDWIVFVKETGGLEELANAIVNLFAQVSKGDDILIVIQRIRCKVQRLIHKSQFVYHPIARLVLHHNAGECDYVNDSETHTNVTELERAYKGKGCHSGDDSACCPSCNKLGTIPVQYTHLFSKGWVTEVGLQKTVSDDELRKIIIDSANEYDKLLKKFSRKDSYKRSYSEFASWERCCGPAPTKCALILVAIAPMLVVLTAVMKHTAISSFDQHRIGDTSNRMGAFFKAAGYNIATDINEKKTVDVFKYNVDFADGYFIANLREISGLSTNG